MKKYLILSLMLCGFGGICQPSIRLFTGINFSNSKYRFIDHIMDSDSTASGTYYILPTFGTDICWPINKTLEINSGLELGWIGSRDYQKDIPIGVNIDSNLRMGYLRIPIGLNQELFKYLFVSAEYNFNYFFRKNQQFFAYDQQNMKLINIYHQYYHSISIGLIKRFDNITFEINYEKSISKIYDTKEFYPEGQIYLTIDNFQVTVGYILY